MDTIFSDDKVTVTHSLVKTADGVTYQIRQINSTHLTSTPPNRLGFAFVGFIVGLIVMGIFSSILKNVDFLQNVLPIFNLGIVGYCIYFFMKKAKADHFIALRTSSGEIKAFHSKDQAWVGKVNDSILEAMTKAA